MCPNVWLVLYIYVCIYPVWILTIRRRQPAMTSTWRWRTPWKARWAASCSPQPTSRRSPPWTTRWVRLRLSGIPYVTPQTASCVKSPHDCFPHTYTAEALFSIWPALMRVLAFARGLRLPIGGLVCCWAGCKLYSHACCENDLSDPRDHRVNQPAEDPEGFHAQLLQRSQGLHPGLAEISEQRPEGQHTRMLTHTHTHTHTHTLRHSHTQTCSYTHTRSCTHTHSRFI